MDVCRSLCIGILVAGFGGVAAAGAGNNWPQFRGPGGSGISDSPESAKVPTNWDRTNNVAWRIEVPGRGWSSPIVWGDKVFVTTAVSLVDPARPSSKDQHAWLVIAYALETGKNLWEHEVHKGVPGGIHMKNSYASQTPVTDGRRVYAWFGGIGILTAINTDGTRAWSVSVPPLKMREDIGAAASPVLYGDRIYVVHDNDEKSYAMAIDAASGKEIWRVDRESEKTSWSTPCVWENEKRTELVAMGSVGITSYDLEGKILWQLKGSTLLTVPTPLTQHGLLYAGSGFVGQRPRPIYAIRPGASGDISLKKGETSNAYVAWCQPMSAPYVPSFLVYRKHLYVLADNGTLSCCDALTGAPHYRQSIGGNCTASPWAYDGKVFCLSENGETSVVQAGPEFKVLARNTLNERCQATPAVAGDRLLIRTSSRLYCIGSER